MNRTRLLRVAGVVAAFTTLGGAAGAQDTTVSRGEVAKAPSYVALMAAVNATPTTVAALKARAEIKTSDITFVDAGPLMKAESDSALKNALEAQAAALEDLRGALGAQAAVSEALARHAPKLALADIIAVDLHVDGTMDVYFKQKH
jgi:hypothetical protein